MKRSFTLIELLISLGLLALLFSSLFFWYFRLHSQGDFISEKKWPLIEERYAEQRLSKIIPLITLAGDQKHVYCFFTPNDQSLVFTFDRGPHINPLLSHVVLGKLYFDTLSSTLNVTYWPLPIKGENVKKIPSETLVLLDEIEELNFSFYSPPRRSALPVDPKEVSPFLPQETWQPSWEEKFKKLPLYVKVIVKRKANLYYGGRELTFAYEIPSAKEGIIFQ